MTLKATRRALYRYVCRQCTKSRYSFVYDRAAQDQICRKCRREMPNPNQAPLFPEQKVEFKGIGETPVITNVEIIETPKQ